ncbi:YnbE family lipoprotein [Arthrobacter sp. TPD3018]|uniref:YnbE family lipoprotein n=1 Tax=Bacteria TaxID=2 RepID=UPI000D5152A9|nr:MULTISPECIES: YnbE family lipoprotein [Bacteria]PVE59364.1 YnbE family lipoprotein [Sphingomonas sp. TPD3009]PVE60884.1 YnbE family lipoprotein [Arthrobacter sp. TPD3018]PVE87564.1 YnbE family lipoprotein [Sphingomonas melonis]
MVKRITTLRIAMGMAGIGMAATLGGCINVSAPEKPIQINLNISVTQQVVYRLDGEAKALIEKQPGIF